MKAGVKSCLNCEHCREVYPGLGVVHCGQVVEAMQGIDPDFAYECSDYKPTLPEVKPEPKLLVRWRGILSRTLRRLESGDLRGPAVWPALIPRSQADTVLAELRWQELLEEWPDPKFGLLLGVVRGLRGDAPALFLAKLLDELEMTTRAEQCLSMMSDKHRIMVPKLAKHLALEIQVAEWQLRLFQAWGLVSNVQWERGKGLTWYSTELLHRVAALMAEVTTEASENTEGEPSA